MYTTPKPILGALYAQKVTIYWSKAGRGMPDAGRRAHCPPAFVLSAGELTQLARTNTYSSIVMWERSAYAPEQTVETHFSFYDPHDWGAVAVKFPHNEGAVVRYTYSRVNVGAPDRSHRPPLSCPLGLDEVVRVTYNGRASWPLGAWRYEHTTFNFVLTERPTLEMFLAEPVRQITDLADLW
jgi:hypothetical protein